MTQAFCSCTFLINAVKICIVCSIGCSDLWALREINLVEEAPQHTCVKDTSPAHDTYKPATQPQKASDNTQDITTQEKKRAADAPQAPEAAMHTDETPLNTQENSSIVTLKALHKITGRLSTLKVPLNKTVDFERLKITPFAYVRSQPEEEPEAAVFLRIIEENPKNETETEIFSNWMFASTPSAIAMEHPMYDVWLVDAVTNTL